MKRYINFKTIIFISLTIIILFCLFKKYNKYNKYETFYLKKKCNIPLFYINLDRSTDRKKQMEKQLPKYFSNFKRIKAIDGEELKPNIYKNKLVDDINYDLINFKEIIKKQRGKHANMIGCLLSHIKTINEINKKKYQYSIVMEDDIDLKYLNNSNNNLQKIINNAPNDWEILKLHNSNQNKLKKNIDLYKQNIKYRKWDYDDWSTGFYIINEKAINNILKDISNKTFKINKKKNNSIAADEYLYKNNIVYEYTKPLFCSFENNKSLIENSGLNDNDKESLLITNNFYKNNN